MEYALKFISKALVILSVLVFAVTAEAYRVEIIPINPDQAAYSMKINEEVTFAVKAYTEEEKGSPQDEEIPIRKIFWQFDYSYLQKIDLNGAAVKLKAIKEGRVNLIVTGIVDNYPFTKSIAVTIEK